MSPFSFVFILVATYVFLLFRGDHIVPSFEELFPGLRGDDETDICKRKKHIGDDYYQNAMEVH